MVPWSFTADGTRLAFGIPPIGSRDEGAAQILTVPVETDGQQMTAGTPEGFAPSKFAQGAAALSLDGRRLAYASNESGSFEVYVRPFQPGTSGAYAKWLVSNGGGQDPQWSPTADELLYRSGDRIMVVGYAVNGETLELERPSVRVEALGGEFWDLAPDGRIAVRTEVDAGDAASEADHHVVFLQNLSDELRRRVPVE